MYLDVSSFNTKNVTDMSNMFDGCSNLKSIDVSNFDTKNLLDASGMFCNCSNLIDLDLSNFKYRPTEDFGIYNMFKNCSSLSTLDLTGFDTTNENKYLWNENAFQNCTSLKTIYATDKLVIKPKDDEYAEYSVDNIFYGCTSLVGGAGTEYKAPTLYEAPDLDLDLDGSENETWRYAHIDEGFANPGYFTKKYLFD